MGRFAEGVAVLVALAGCERILGLDHVTVQAASPRALVFDNRSSASDLMDFPVLVSFTAQDVDVTSVSDPSRDLRFHDEATAADLPFEVERWDPSGTSVVWVRVPLIHGGLNTDGILMHFGPDAGGSAMPGAVWGDYDLVFHADAMVDSTGRTTPEAVNAGNDPQSAPGEIGNAFALDGVTGRGVHFKNSSGLFDGWPTFTLELWVEPQYPDPVNLGTEPGNPNQPIEPLIIDKPGGAVQLGRIHNSVTGKATPFEMQTDFHWNTSLLQGATFYLPDATWSQVTFAYDGQTLWSYRDGVVLDLYSNKLIDPTLPSSQDLYLGTNGGGLPLLGEIDELRISRSYRDPDWVTAQYLSMTRHFVTITDP